MAKKKRGRKRSFSEKVMLVLGLIIAISMLVGMVVGLGSSGQPNAPLPESERMEEMYIEPVSAIDAAHPALADLPSTLAPPFV